MVRISLGLLALASVTGCSTTVPAPAPAPACRADCAGRAQLDRARTPAPVPAPDPAPAEPLANDVPAATWTIAASSGLAPLVSARAGTGGALGSLAGSAPLGLGRGPTPTPRVTVGVPTVGPALSAAVVRRIILRRRMRLRFCYERALATTPTLAGPVHVRFVIDPTGVVTKAAVTTGLDPAVDACLVDVLHATRFPAPSGGAATIVTYPFTFAPPTGP